jgi:hypothetical protein
MLDLVLCLIQEQEANATVGHGLGVAPSMIITKSTEMQFNSLGSLSSKV